MPAGLPPGIVTRPQTELRSALQLPDVRERITFDGAEVIAGSFTGFGDYIKSALNRRGRIIRDRRVQAQGGRARAAVAMWIAGLWMRTSPVRS